MTTQTAAAQQCFRSRPLLKEKGSVVSFFSCMARQKRTHGVSLHERAGVSPAVPPFLQRLLTVRIRLRIVLRHLQLIGIEFDHLAAGTFSLAFEMLHKLAHSPPIRRSSEAALKRSVIVFLNFDRTADLQQIVLKADGPVPVLLRDVARVELADPQFEDAGYVHDAFPFLASVLVAAFALLRGATRRKPEEES